MSERIKERKLFKGNIEIDVEAETKGEAEKVLSELTHQIINQWKSVYRVRYTMPEKEGNNNG